MGDTLSADLSDISKLFSLSTELTSCRKEACPAFMEHRFLTFQDFDSEACSEQLSKTSPEIAEKGCGLARLALPTFVRKESL
jgi:hypothetical protein